MFSTHNSFHGLSSFFCIDYLNQCIYIIIWSSEISIRSNMGKHQNHHCISNFFKLSCCFKPPVVTEEAIRDSSGSSFSSSISSSRKSRYHDQNGASSSTSWTSRSVSSLDKNNKNSKKMGKRSWSGSDVRSKVKVDCTVLVKNEMANSSLWRRRCGGEELKCLKLHKHKMQHL